jgi:adenine nucleotide transporter 17
MLGIMSKTIATVVTYPYIMAKVRMQWKAADYEINDRVRYKSAMDVLYRVLQEHGWTGLYQVRTK